MISETACHSKSTQLRLAQASIVLSALVYSLHFTSFLHPKEIVLSIGLILLAASAIRSGLDLRSAVREYRPLWVLWTVSVMIHVGIGYAAQPHFAIITLAHFALILLAAALVYPVTAEARGRWGLINAVILAGAIAAVLGLLQIAGAIAFLLPPFPEYEQPMYSVFGNRNLLAAWLVMAMPLALHIFVSGRFRPWLYGAATVAMTAALVLCGSRTGWVAGFLGAAAVIVLTPMPLVVRARWGLALSVVIFISVGALAFLASEAAWERAQHSAQLRWWFWNGAGAMFAGHPIFGVGPGHFAYWSPVYLGQILWHWNGQTTAFNEVHTWHAHNDGLELAAIWGIFGTLCIMAFIAKRLPCRGPEWYGLIPLTLMALVNPVFSSVPHAFIALVLAGALLPLKSNEHPPRRFVNGILACFVLVLTAFLALSHWWPSYALRGADDAQLAGQDASHRYAQIAAQPWPNPYAERGLAIARMESKDFSGAAEAWQRTLREGLQDGEAYYGLAVSALWSGDSGTAASAAIEGLARWPANADLWSIRIATTPDSGVAALASQASPFVGEHWETITQNAIRLRSEFGL